jgi:phosphoribosylanthranilate isomerase
MIREINTFFIKVCGLRDHKQIHRLLALPKDIRPRMLGVILYEQSSRYAYSALSSELFSIMKQNNVHGVIVTVNMAFDELREIILQYQPSAVQLHGQETIEYVQALRDEFLSLCIIKAVSVTATDTAESIASKARLYEDVSDFILLDTASATHGGTGKKFDWNLLMALPKEILSHIILAGGIADTDADRIATLASMIAGIDINSKFEIMPAHKDIPRITVFLEHLSSLIFTNV